MPDELGLHVRLCHAFLVVRAINFYSLFIPLDLYILHVYIIHTIKFYSYLHFT